jgi:hypothetical protein
MLNEKIKEIIVQLAVDDKLPMDLNDLDASIFDKVFDPIISVLRTIKEDAQMALDGDWDCTTQEGIETGFTAQIALVDSILNDEVQREEEFIGHVGVDSGQLMLCDPCYIDSQWEKEDFEDIRIFKHVTTGETLQYIKDFAHFEEVIPKYGKTMNELNRTGEWEQVDLPEAESGFSYNACCAKTLSEKGAGQLYYKMGHAGAGVAFSTAWGDGVYPVFKVIEGGELKGVIVKFE